MNQFLKILQFELKYYWKNKIFVGVTAFLMVLIAGVMFFPRIAAGFQWGASSQNPEAERPVMLVKVAEEDQASTLQGMFAASFSDYQVLLSEEGEEQIKNKVISKDVACAFVITDPTSFSYYVNQLSMTDQNDKIASQMLGELYRMNAMVDGGMSPEEASTVLNTSVTSRVVNLGKDQTENYFYTYIMIAALYTVILLYGTMVATNVATEKSSRAMEVLITSAKPTSMMFGKVIASCLAGLVQLVAVFGSSLLFYHLNESYWGDNMLIRSLFNISPELLLYMLLFFILGFLIYAFMFGAVGSTASKLEDINTSTLPINILFVVAFFVVSTSMNTGELDNLLMKVCSFVPFTSPMAMFTRIAMSTVPWYEILISVLILVGSTVGVGVFSAKIYRVGVLMYGTPPKISTLLKSIWNA